MSEKKKVLCYFVRAGSFVALNSSLVPRGKQHGGK